jgi:hypothetical protein
MAMINDLDLKKYPPLTDGRLSLLAGALRDVRKDAVSLYDPLNGDDEWSHGCRVYARSKFKIRQLAIGHPWLTIVLERERLRFTFAVEGIPIRFYKGSPDDPPENYLVTTFGELAQRQLFENLRPLDKILRLAVETNREGFVSTVKLVELDEAGEPTGVYLIPFDVASSNVTPLESKPINLREVTAEPRLEQTEQLVQKRKQNKNK